MLNLCMKMGFMSPATSRREPFALPYLPDVSRNFLRLPPCSAIRQDYPPTRMTTVKILKIGTPEIITIIVLQLEQLDFTVQYCVQKMQTE